MMKISTPDLSLKITNLKLQSHFPGANELIAEFLIDLLSKDDARCIFPIFNYCSVCVMVGKPQSEMPHTHCE